MLYIINLSIKKLLKKLTLIDHLELRFLTKKWQYLFTKLKIFKETLIEDRMTLVGWMYTITKYDIIGLSMCLSEVKSWLYNLER